VDFLRAASLCAVVLGHWLMAAPRVGDGGASLHHLLSISPWTHFLTWFFQVMPIFFFVGGWSNATTWSAARRDGLPFSDWLHRRAVRLLLPVGVLLLFWLVAGAVAAAAGLDPEILRVASRIALVPVWFLAVYLAVVALVPVTHGAWCRWGMGSFWGLIAAACFIDWGFFSQGWDAFGWTNYLVLWAAVHQLGYAWKDGRLASARLQALCAAGGFALLVWMVRVGPWPVSLVGVPGDPVSNTAPPHLPLLALAGLQFGMVRLLEAPLNRWLSRPIPWTATLILSSSLMTLFLWHSTSMMLLIGAAFWAGGVGMHADPASLAWWAGRLLWLPLLAAALAPFLAGFGRFERPKLVSAGPPSATRQVLGLLFACVGLAFLADGGVTGPGWLGLAWVPLGLALAGIFVAIRVGSPFFRPFR
jgi:hypothetical protein